MNPPATDEVVARARRVLAAVPSDGLFATGQAAGAPFRIAPAPYPLPPGLAETLRSQGPLWLAFVRGANALYHASVRGEAPAWVAEYLDAGKPRRVVEYGRMNRFRAQLPAVLRPDLLLTADGVVACELDSLPGGIGLLACLQRLYEAESMPSIGSPDGMVGGFARAMERVAGTPSPRGALVVSEESAMYRPEMRWLAAALGAAGARWEAVPPEGVRAGTDGVSLSADPNAHVDVLYRFFELFDLPRVAGSMDLLESAKLKRARMTPPPKAFLEEKLLFALLHHPALAGWWEAELGAAAFAALLALVVPTFVLDPRPMPPHGTIAGVAPGGRALQGWEALAELSQRDRAFVIKPSGFAEDAWGSHGVRIGPDCSHEEWSRAVREALETFPDRPRIVQPYRKPARVGASWYDPGTDAMVEMDGRVRLCPYYFVTGDNRTELGGVLATICPAEKKAVHGMPEAIMAPCA